MALNHNAHTPPRSVLQSVTLDSTSLLRLTIAQVPRVCAVLHPGKLGSAAPAFATPQPDSCDARSRAPARVLRAPARVRALACSPRSLLVLVRR